MLSYSTGTSGAGSDVEKVREATRLAQEKRPDLMNRRSAAVRRCGNG
ncbi:phosphate acyltransferase [Shigella flexneri]